MDFEFSPRVQQLGRQLQDFMDNYVVPNMALWRQEIGDGLQHPACMEDLKSLAKSEGLWNLFLPALEKEHGGQGLTNLEYAPLAEIMGRVHWASEAFNCSAPDAGNMELLHMFGSEAQRERWLKPLLDGSIRSCFAMSEPDVASSDATNIQLSMRRVGDAYVINGRKWFISGAAHPLCRFAIVMGVTNPDAEVHRRQSMVIVPFDTPGLSVVRNIPVMSHSFPGGHCELVFRDVRVPAANLIHEEGAGFAMAQARLGPGRIHHCMRSIGQAELALELMCERAADRRTFGRYLHQHANVAEWIACSRMEIEQARLLVLKTAWMIDRYGAKGAAREIAMIKAIIPRLQTTICDRAMQVFGAMGLSPDTPLAELWTWGRVLRIADGPDEVHLRTVARQEMDAATERRGSTLPFMNTPEFV
ncbi:acyl-CoA dehydrogenase family protein [Noviherbaspirillum denitrificans]|uniref:Acyl-CoA dehydrogenase n=1 Tax=Noviherbaspirillum denitrificans TaxID=1968433 RepID=A0A254THN4_9BURK|nr:acyl-CoA dehydrogenase family protein [Noviherbaspirillum denitrificans]OWW22141.1 acyl-CoA dehydrogenase [Noviherbaspirillum denitrificans]